MESKILIRCSIKSIKIENKVILNKINFVIHSGDCVTVTGDSGSGKTTLLRCISGIDNANVICDGKIYYTEGLKISYVAQNPEANIVSTDVKSELLLYASGNVAKINSILKTFNLPENILEAKIETLSGGQKQLLTIVSGLLQDADLYIFDEPTAMLDKENGNLVTDVIKRIVKDGKTVLISTHDRRLVEICSNIINIRGHKKVYKKYSIGNLNSKYIRTILEFDKVSFGYKKNNLIISDLTLSLKNYDVLLIVGKNGSGKSTLGKLMSGLIKPITGTINLNGEKIRKIRNYLPNTFSFSFQNPSVQLLFNTVEEEMLFTTRKYKSNSNNFSATNFVDTTLDATNIKKNSEPRDLSFGQKKFITNLSFLHNPVLHFFDEPDMGLDTVYSKYFMDYLFIRKKMGLISIIVSHDEEKYKSIYNKKIEL